jgi:hypothetical protein
VAVSSDGFQSHRSEARLDEGENRLTVVLTRTRLRTLQVLVRSEVRDRGQERLVPIPGATVAVRRKDGTPVGKPGQTDAAGRFKMELESGEYVVTAAKDRYPPSRPTPADLTRGDVQVEIRLTRVAGEPPGPGKPPGATPPGDRGPTPGRPPTTGPAPTPPGAGVPPGGSKPMDPRNPNTPKPNDPKPGGKDGKPTDPPRSDKPPPPARPSRPSVKPVGP